MDTTHNTRSITSLFVHHPWLTAFLLVTIYLTIFRGLGDAPLLQWDESRRGVNALEMIEQDSWLIPYFEDKSDQWATKPPMLPLIQSISIRTFGVSEWAIRLPVALFALATILLITAFSWYISGSAYLAFMAGFILLATRGYIHYHISITGDYDGLLIFFITLTSFAFFSAIEDPDPKRKKIAWWTFGIALALGTLSKGIAAWLFTPALVLYLLWRREFISTLKNPRAWMAVLVTIAVVFSYYFTREQLDPGYLKAVWENELGGRYLSTVEGHKYPWNYYLSMFFERKFLPWYVFIPFAFTLTKKGSLTWNALIFLSICSLVQMVVVSFSSTKLAYYEAPVYPWVAILSAVGISNLLYEKLSFTLRLKSINISREWTTLFIFFMVWAVPWLVVFPHKEKQLKPIDEVRIGAFTRELDEEDNYFLAHHGYSAHDIFYAKKLQSEGKNVRLNAIDYLSPGDRLVLCQKEHWERLNNWFTWELIKGETDQCALVRMVKKIKK